jgi:hypothetical protein
MSEIRTILFLFNLCKSEKIFETVPTKIPEYPVELLHDRFGGKNNLVLLSM